MPLLAFLQRSLRDLLGGIAPLFGVNLPELLNPAECRQQTLTAIAIGLPVGALFAIVNFSEGFPELALAEALSASLLPVAVWLLGDEERWINLAEWLVLLWGALVTTALVVYGGIEGSGVLWIFSFPFLAFFLKGLQNGWLISLSWVAVCTVARAASPHIPAAWPYSPSYTTQLTAAMLCATVIAAVFTLVRVRFMLQLVKARERSEAANQAKSRFLAATSHDLRQPLMAVSLFLDALSHTALDKDQQRFAKHLRHSVQSMNDMINTLLAIARLDTGAVQARPEPVSATALFTWLENEFASTFIARRLRFKLFFPMNDMQLLADLDLLKNILRNLIGNALKFCPEGGVLVGIRRRRGEALIQVWDSGIGIPAEHVGKIFDEYHQVGNEARDGTKGVGLGLAIVRRQLQLMGSEIVCRSRTGRGSVFEFTLPLAQ